MHLGGGEEAFGFASECETERERERAVEYISMNSTVVSHQAFSISDGLVSVPRDKGISVEKLSDFLGPIFHHSAHHETGKSLAPTEGPNGLISILRGDSFNTPLYARSTANANPRYSKADFASLKVAQ